jgi:plasmid stabilization system protein ParE
VEIVKVSYSPRALREIAEIYAYIVKENPAGAERVRDRIKEVAALVGDFPSTGRAVSMKNIRVIPVDPYPYLVFFREVPRQREVRILRVRHAARRRLYVNEPAREFAR